MMLGFLFLLMTVSICSVKTNFNYTSELYKELLTDQDPRARPSLNASIPTDVYVAMHLLSLREIVETQQLYHINVWMEFVWQDEIRIWNPDEYGGLRVIYPNAGDTWIPRVFVSNSIEKRDIFTGINTIYAILSDGNARWYPGSIISAACELDLTYFPFDSQDCNVQLITQHFEWDVNLVAMGNSVDISDYDQNCEWVLVSTKVIRSSVRNEVSSLGVLFFKFTFKRRSIFYIINVFSPVIMISLLAPLVFLLPEESGERASYSVTLLLSQTVFLTSVSGKLPQCSHPLPLVVAYIFVMLIHSSLCVVCTVIQLKLIQRKSDQVRNQRSVEMDDPDRRNQQGFSLSGCNKNSDENVANGPDSTEGRFVDSKNLQLNHIMQCNGSDIQFNDRSTAAFRTTAVADQEKVKHTGFNKNSRIMRRLWYQIKPCLNNCNLLLFAFFYVSWFAASAYFTLRFVLKG